MPFTDIILIKHFSFENHPSLKFLSVLAESRTLSSRPDIVAIILHNIGSSSIFFYVFGVVALQNSGQSNVILQITMWPKGIDKDLMDHSLHAA